jgi:hypothetical protein
MMTVEAGWLLRACDGSGWLALYGLAGTGCL